MTATMIDVGQLLANLLELTQRLANDHRELGQLLMAEKQAKVSGFEASGQNTIAGRQNEGDVQALNITTDIFKLRASIAAYEVERDYLKTAIGVGLQLESAGS